MSTVYTYSLTNDFPNGKLNATMLIQEINVALPGATLENITTNGDEVLIQFTEALSPTDKDTLDTVIGDHIGETTSQSAIHSQSIGESSTSSTSWVEKLNLQATALKRGDYLFTWYCEIKTNGAGVAAQVTYNGNEQGFTSWGENQYHAFSGSVIASQNEGSSPLIALNFRILGSGPVFIRRARMSISLMDREV